MYTFQATLFRPDGTGTWTCVSVPFSVEEKFGVKSQVPVKGTINGHPFRSSLLPQGEGRHILVVNGELRAAIGLQAGDSAEIALERDDAPRVVLVPDDFQAAMAQAPTAKEYFEQISYSQQKVYVDWIEDAKKAETRAARIAKAADRLAEGRPLK